MKPYLAKGVKVVVGARPYTGHQEAPGFKVAKAVLSIRSGDCMKLLF